MAFTWLWTGGQGCGLGSVHLTGEVHAGASPLASTVVVGFRCAPTRDIAPSSPASGAACPPAVRRECRSHKSVFRDLAPGTEREQGRER